MSCEELIERITPKLKAITYKINGSCRSLSKEDLFQEAVLHLLVEYNNGKLSDKTDSYVLQGCYFYLKNYIRTIQNKTSLMSLNMPMDEDLTKLQDVLSLETEASNNEGPDKDALMQEVFEKELNRKEKEIFFFYLQGWTTREIGERLGISHVSVVQMEKKIREKCKELKDLVSGWLPNYSSSTCINGYTQ